MSPLSVHAGVVTVNFAPLVAGNSMRALGLAGAPAGWAKLVVVAIRKTAPVAIKMAFMLFLALFLSGVILVSFMRLE